MKIIWTLGKRYLYGIIMTRVTLSHYNVPDCSSDSEISCGSGGSGGNSGNDGTVVTDAVFSNLDHSVSKLRLIVKKSKLEFLGEFNELQDEAYYVWSDVFKKVGIVPAGAVPAGAVPARVDPDTICIQKDDYSKTCDLLNRTLFGESVLDNSMLMTNYATGHAFRPVAKSLYIDTGYEFYSLFYAKFVEQNIPMVIDLCGLRNAYVQLVFYEYIYKSPLYSTYHKLRWIIDNDYDILIELLTEHLIEMIEYDRHSQEEDHHMFWVTLVEYCYDDETKYERFKSLMVMHSKILRFDVHTVTDHAVFEFYDIVMNDQSKFENWNHVISDFESRNPGFFNSFESYALHPKICAHNLITCTNWAIEHIFPIDIDKIVSKASSRHISQSMSYNATRYYVINILMRLLERKHPITTTMMDKSKASIVCSWITMSDTVIRNSNLRYTMIDDVPNRYLDRLFTRPLVITTEIIEIFGKIRMDLSELTYIYLMDELELFQAITMNCTFFDICRTMMCYYPARIIEYIVNTHYNANYDRFAMRVSSKSSLDVPTLCKIGQLRTSLLFDRIVYSTHVTRVDIKSLVGQNLTHLENEYMMMEHEMSELHKTCDLGDILSILFAASCASHSGVTFDMAYKRLSNVQILATIAYAHYGNTVCNAYISKMVTDPDFDRCGPDLGEIWWEFNLIHSHDQCKKHVEKIVTLRNDYLLENENENDDVIDLKEYANRSLVYDVDSDADDYADADADVDVDDYADDVDEGENYINF